MKINIVVDKTLSSGQKANVSSIIMGQLGHDMPSIYTCAIVDVSGAKHAGISVNVVILDGNSRQLLKLIELAQNSDVTCIAFSAAGQSLSNNYDEYYQTISSSVTESTNIVGVGVCGDDEIVKLLTKKFSLAK